MFIQGIVIVLALVVSLKLMKAVHVSEVLESTVSENESPSAGNAPNNNRHPHSDPQKKSPSADLFQETNQPEQDGRNMPLPGQTEDGRNILLQGQTEDSESMLSSEPPGDGNGHGRLFSGQIGDGRSMVLPGQTENRRRVLLPGPPGDGRSMLLQGNRKNQVGTITDETREPVGNYSERLENISIGKAEAEAGRGGGQSSGDNIDGERGFQKRFHIGDFIGRIPENYTRLGAEEKSHTKQQQNVNSGSDGKHKSSSNENYEEDDYNLADDYQTNQEKTWSKTEDSKSGTEASKSGTMLTTACSMFRVVSFAGISLLAPFLQGYVVP